MAKAAGLHRRRVDGALDGRPGVSGEAPAPLHLVGGGTCYHCRSPARLGAASARQEQGDLKYYAAGENRPRTGERDGNATGEARAPYRDGWNEPAPAAEVRRRG